MKYPLGPRVRVNCTKEVITNAVTANSSKCWIAEAIRATVPNATSVAVDVATTRFSDLEKGFRYVYLTPYAAQKALLYFDEGTPPPPFSFVLKNAHVTKAGTRQSVKDRREKARKIKAKQKTAASGTATLIHRPGPGSLPRRVGGKRPPQLRMMRHFGVRAFRGASQKRLQSEIESKNTLE